MAKKFQDLIASKTPQWKATVQARTRQMLAELPLFELRRARELSQQDLAQALGATQPEVSKIEHRADLYVSTLRRYIEALGGQLEITARFPDGAVNIVQFHQLDTPAKDLERPAFAATKRLFAFKKAKKK